MIEAVDGFHPAQTMNAMFGDWFWQQLTQDHEDWLGPPNPNNDLITSLFGNQGGY